MTLLSSHALATSNINKTNLGEDGNTYVLDRHHAFLKGSKSCEAKDPGSFRVIVQGFSLFTGVKMNISGAVVDTLANLPLSKRSLLEENDFGTRVNQIDLELNGKKIEVCLVVSEVLWDLAAANLISIIKDFKPDFVLMSGRGGKTATLETGARNQSGTLAGYNYDGTYSGNLNRPRSKRVDPRYKSSKIIPATWNFESIYTAINPEIKKLGFKLKLGKEGRSDNDYICNNIHYSILQSVLEGDVELAGGLLRPLLALEAFPAMGFFHYPSGTLNKDPKAELEAWSKVVLNIIKAQLNI
ncbi:MAG: hypothetical protein CME70_16780 [Halobacteriovorax sp.]|nr:hypothetical protein [Halobacteriovorax sp.]